MESGSFSQEDYQRYGRQMLLPFIGRTGQQNIMKASALVIGAGGIGSSLLLYLAAAGVCLTVVDPDTVDRSNLHRQIIHDSDSAGVNKAVSAVQRLVLLNPQGHFTPIASAFTTENASELVSGHDLVIDCTDNVSARYIINDACVLQGRPWVTGSAIGMEGQVHLIIPHQTPCYRCLHPTISVSESCRNCSNVGILGPVAGMIGCLQAIEAMKYLASIQRSDTDSKPEKLSDKQLYYDGYHSEFMSFTLPPRDPHCAVCSEQRSIKSLVDTQIFLNECQKLTEQCVIEHVGSLEEQYEISPNRYYELHYRQDEEVHVILDVRPALQFDLVHLKLPGLVHIPDSTSISSVKGSDLKSRRYLLNISFSLFLALRRLSYEDICAARVITNLLQVLSDIQASCAVGLKVFLMCRRGVDSKIVTRFLIDQARLPYQVYNLTGGCVAWHNEVDANFPLY